MHDAKIKVVRNTVSHSCCRIVHREHARILQAIVIGPAGKVTLQLFIVIVISNHLVRFAIQLISNTRTNRDYTMVCISVYGRRGSFFNISCTKTLFCPEISLVRSDSHSLTLPLSSDTTQVAFHSVQHSAFLL